MISEYLRVFKAIADGNRIRILEILCNGEYCACVLLDDLNISQPTLSHHMKILCDAGIVNSRREGKWSYYSINPDGCEYAMQLLRQIADKKMNIPLKIAVLFNKINKIARKPRISIDSEICPCEKDL
jgi:Predicted transcriptional regulators